MSHTPAQLFSMLFENQRAMAAELDLIKAQHSQLMDKLQELHRALQASGAAEVTAQDVVDTSKDLAFYGPKKSVVFTGAEDDDE